MKIIGHLEVIELEKSIEVDECYRTRKLYRNSLGTWLYNDFGTYTKINKTISDELEDMYLFIKEEANENK